MSTKIYNVIKRFFDISFSAFLLLILFPILIFVSIIIKVESKGPIIYKAKRVGKNEKEFLLFKFRSLKSNAPNNLSSKDIDRSLYITKIGKIIRRTSIDELPQLLNVLKGEMSLIGPRPCFSTEKKLIDLRRKHNVFSIKPGLSGLAQINGRDETAEIVEKKVLNDKEYIKNFSFTQDIKIFFSTIFIIITGKGYKE